MNQAVLFDNVATNLNIQFMKGRIQSQDGSWNETKTSANYTIWIILEGNAFLTVNKKQYLLSEGDTVLYRPGTRHSVYTNQNGCKFLWCYFSLAMGGDIDLLEDINCPGIIPSAHAAKANKRFVKSFIKYYSSAMHLPVRLYSSFLSYLCDITDIILAGKSVLFYNSVKSRNHTTMRSILDYIAEHYSEPLTVEILADRAHLSESRFIAKFKETVGIPPVRYVSEYRLRKSVELLAQTNLKQSEIAHMVGYSDPYSFSRAFKNFFGESPSFVRKGKEF
jgi:AraC family transcriptional regulator